MKNYEKYADEIKKYKRDGDLCDEIIEPKVLSPLGLICHTTACCHCNMLTSLWLLEEYEEPKEPEIDWNKVEVDTPVLVRNSDLNTWEKRYFSEYKHGYYHCWNDGRTSWNATHCESWNYAKLAEEECEK